MTDSDRTISGESSERPQLLLSTSGAKMTYYGYQVVVDIPAMAPDGVGEAVFDVVADACAAMEDTHLEIRERKGWDVLVSGGPVPSPKDVLERLEARYEALSAEVDALRLKLRET